MMIKSGVGRIKNLLLRLLPIATLDKVLNKLDQCFIHSTSDNDKKDRVVLSGSFSVGKKHNEQIHM